MGKLVSLLFNRMSFTLEKQQRILQYLMFTFSMERRVMPLPNVCVVTTKRLRIKHESNKFFCSVLVILFQQDVDEQKLMSFCSGVLFRVLQGFFLGKSLFSVSDEISGSYGFIACFKYPLNHMSGRSRKSFYVEGNEANG